MKITFLGTSAGVPTTNRNVSCVALRFDQRGEVWLFDCGEGTQQQVLRSDVKISGITRIFITHLHGDHLFGLVGLLATCGMANQVARIDLYGPPGLGEYVQETARRSETRFAYPVEVHTLRGDGGEVFADEDYVVTYRALEHRVPAYGFRVQERDRPGSFDAGRAQALGIPFGPLYGKLKRGETITLPDGRTFDGADLCGPTQRGRSVVYCTDTIYARNSVALARDADALIHEATFADEDEHLARQSLHSTAGMAARVAQEAGVRQLVLTHFSPRYAPGGKITLEQLSRQAKNVFPQTQLAHDFLTVDVPRRQVEVNNSVSSDSE